MSRPRRKTVDFFPHYAKHGKTIFILKQKFGNTGYAFWFQLLEQLASHEGHFVDLNSDAEMEFFAAGMGVSATETISLLDLLSKLDAIDPILWQKRVIWCQKFVDNLSEVYRKRGVSAPKMPVSVAGMGVSVAEMPQSRVEESKVNKFTEQSSDNKPMFEETIIETDELGETTQQTKFKLPRGYIARIAQYYMQVFNVPVSTGLYFAYKPTIEEMVRLSRSIESVGDDLEKIEQEIKSRIDLCAKRQIKEGWKKIKLITILENWNEILTWKYD